MEEELEKMFNTVFEIPFATEHIEQCDKKARLKQINAKFDEFYPETPKKTTSTVRFLV